ncbi:MAG: hypothetical protein A2X94_04265 [Bdellovibrionales bacterium GWB1_55_8]|nr:MAG: hypothetical protein A2X94_04265 [Bdellovibrionales bacterium GWB1_55_8]
MIRSFFPFKRPVALVLVGATLMLGCTRQPSREEQSALKVQLSTEPVSLDPALAEDGVSLRILANTMEGLVGYDSAGQLRLRLAESHRVSNDRKRHEFKLQRNACWSDGIQVTAAQFVRGFQRSLGPDSKSKLAPLLSGLRVHENDGILVIELEKPAPHLLHALTLPVAFPIRDDILSANGGKWPLTAPGTGPYAIRNHLPDRKIQLERNPHYYLDASGPAQVDLVIVGDETTAANLFDQGKLDILTKLPPADFARLKKSGRVRTDPFFATYFLSFNTRQAPFNDPALRRAVSGAINREEVVAILDSGELPASGWLPPGIEGATPYRRDRLGQGLFRKYAGKSVIAGFDGNTRNFLIMQKVQQDVQQKLGLRVQLRNTDWKSHIQSLQTDTPAIYRFGWQAPFNDPISHLRAFTSRDPNNYSGWKNAKYDRLISEIETMESGPDRVAKIARAEELLVKTEAAAVPLYHYVQNHGVSKRVSGFRANPFGMIFFRELQLDRGPKSKK